MDGFLAIRTAVRTSVNLLATFSGFSVLEREAALQQILCTIQIFGFNFVFGPLSQHFHRTDFYADFNLASNPSLRGLRWFVLRVSCTKPPYVRPDSGSSRPFDHFNYFLEAIASATPLIKNGSIRYVWLGGGRKNADTVCHSWVFFSLAYCVHHMCSYCIAVTNPACGLLVRRTNNTWVKHTSQHLSNSRTCSWRGCRCWEGWDRGGSSSNKPICS